MCKRSDKLWESAKLTDSQLTTFYRYYLNFLIIAIIKLNSNDKIIKAKDIYKLYITIAGAAVYG